jgi:hypothetical protein
MQDLIVSNRTDKKIRTYLVGQDPMRGIFYRPLNQLHSHTVRDQAVQDQERNRILGEPLLNSGRVSSANSALGNLNHTKKIAIRIFQHYKRFHCEFG